jgi:hypothetical protein
VPYEHYFKRKPSTEQNHQPSVSQLATFLT